MRRVYAALFLNLFAFLLMHAAARAQENQAGVVVVKGDDAVVTRCVSFAEESISGYELIVRTGLDIDSEQSAAGSAVCALDGLGCAFPQESCFCQCMGSPCVYWSYWRQDDAGVWAYANRGALSIPVRHGMVQGWVWGPGTVAEAPSPPALTFADICAAPQTAADASSVQTQTSAAAGSAQAADPAPVETAAQPNVGMRTVGLYVLVLLAPPAVAGLLLRRRRRQP